MKMEENYAEYYWTEEGSERKELDSFITKDKTLLKKGASLCWFVI